MTLDEYIAAKDLTDKRFGEQIGMSKMQVSRYRRGLAVPRPKAMEKISKATGGQVPPESFYTIPKPRRRRSKS